MDVSAIAGAEAQRIANAYRSRGLEITALGVYGNPIEPDPSELERNIDYFIDMMRIAREIDIPFLATEPGSVIQPGKGKELNQSLSDEAYVRLVESTHRIAEAAAEHEVVVLFEPYFHSLLATAKATRDFIEEIDHPNIRVQLDPANLLPHNSLDEMFQALTPYVDAIHAKDRKLHVARGVPAGQGDLEYARFVSLCREHLPHLPLIIEYVDVDTCADAIAHLKQYLQSAALEAM